MLKKKFFSLQKIPFIGEYFHKEIPPSDNVSLANTANFMRMWN